VTFSLGAPGIFLLGGNSREEDVPTAMLLRRGDCLVMSGRSRGYFHGVPTVLLQDEEDEDVALHGGSACAADDDDDAASPFETSSIRVFPELSDSGTLVEDSNSTNDEDASCICLPSLDEMRFMKAFLTTVRMNMSIRQV